MDDITSLCITILTGNAVETRRQKRGSTNQQRKVAEAIGYDKNVHGGNEDEDD